MRAARSFFQRLATVWEPWPRVASEMGRRMNLALGISVTWRWAMPSSGGLMKSSAELIQSRGTLILARLPLGS